MIEQANLSLLVDVSAALAVVVALASVGEALVEFFIAPIWDRFKLDGFWLPYVAAVVCGLLVGLSGANLLDGLLAPELTILGRVLTALLAGRGSSFVHDFFGKQLAQKEAAQRGG